MSSTLLGGLTPAQFLADYWQKKPLLIRQAVTDFPELIDLARLKALAQRDDVQSRLIEFKRDRWHLAHGPFEARRFNRLGECDWTLLVQDVNHHIEHIDRLLHRFDFLPYYRLDDLMISYAPPGGSVGPHYDSYDVFLLQVGGAKRWQISADDAGNFIEDAPIRVLKSFTSEQEWVLEHGDMLYLPPKYAHYGVALTAGMTYSIGFRAPTSQEIVGRFLDFLQDELRIEGMYADPGRQPTAEPGLIDDGFARDIAGMLQHIRWDEQQIARFAGRYFTEPKPHVYFEPPEAPLAYEAFCAAVASGGVTLDLKTQLLYDAAGFYINGDDLAAAPQASAALKTLANRRALPAGEYDETVLEALYACYDYGYLYPMQV
ncbi:cupin domain-containing protein [Chitiniphilus purpureus]|uniref:Cupin domain-containing protein n=1 Tax=Chitiniphilus purpureus TaxID=2981137 RepID=A0ABY6DJN9_9NEIS|nr:cupin domain-containing protein [Chitiniphilus sp. CD1]UXY14579.1 cupin domain-containing protein [Chitiniphilus sp. CD1]